MPVFSDRKIFYQFGSFVMKKTRVSFQCVHLLALYTGCPECVLTKSLKSCPKLRVGVSHRRVSIPSKSRVKHSDSNNSIRSYIFFA